VSVYIVHRKPCRRDPQGSFLVVTTILGPNGNVLAEVDTREEADAIAAAKDPTYRNEEEMA